VRKTLVLTGFDPLTHTGGIETFTLEFIRLARGLNIHADLLCASAFQNVYRLRNTFLGQVYAAGRSLLSLQPESYDFVVSNGYYGGGFFPKQFRTVTIFHSTHAGYAEAVKELVPRSVYLEIKHVVGEIFEQTAAFSAHVVAVSEKVKSELGYYYGIQNIDVIPNPVDTDFFYRLPHKDLLRKKYGISSDRKVGLFVGRWETSKGKDLVEGILQSSEDLFWIIVSSTGGETSPPGNGNVLNFSTLNREEIRELYSLSDFMLFPSRYEGFGLAAAEAMASGLPVIGTPVGFLENVYREQPFSSLSLSSVSPDNHDAIPRVKDIIHELLSDGRLWRGISEQGRVEIEKKYSKIIWQRRMKEVLCLN
jgi:glycosyltransferase involved in cell wall biosynthesis